MNYDDKIIEQENKLKQQVSVQDEHIVINVCYEYNIALSGCDTAEKLLHWVWRLTEKTWMTNDVMRRFIAVACNEKI